MTIHSGVPWGRAARALSFTALLGGLGCSGSTASNGSGGQTPVFGAMGGMTASGGTGGVSSGGSTSTNRCAQVPAGSEPRIDNFEDGNLVPVSEPLRNGHWGAGNNDAQPAVTFAIESPGADGTDFAGHLSSLEATENGLSLGLSMNLNGVACPYNAGNSTGISFYTRGSGRIRLLVSTQAIITTEWGGSCDERVAKCWDAYAKQVPLATDWTYHEARWDAFSQAGWGDAVAFDPSTIMNMMFIPVPDGSPVELWLDELKFMQAEAP
ncbi:MAG: hypothetical protein QM756_03380 [Polyangiaceae bacterium]